MKCFRSLLMALALTGILCASAGAYTGTFPVEADGQSTGVQACLMVPLRAVAEPLGFTVTWDDGGVLVDNGTLHTRVVIGQDRYTLTTSIDGLVGMSAPFSLGAPPYVANGVTYVPVALFDALLGDGAVTVTDSGTVSIQAPPPAALPWPTPSRNTTHWHRRKRPPVFPCRCRTGFPTGWIPCAFAWQTIP